MNQRILFVDDDTSILSMLDRNFSLDFDVTTAESGPNALALIESEEAFAVVMCDMRMPGMEGVEVIERAREIAPDTTYIMLTGNQDLTTAIEAVNRGQVFRFLNKPCQIDEITQAIDAGLRQYDLVTSQKELLNQTFTGAVGVLTEIIESMESPVVDSKEVQNIAIELSAAMGIETNWAMALSARLMTVGLPLLSPSQRRILAAGSISTETHHEIVTQVIDISRGLITKIPRLQPVTEILNFALQADGKPTRDLAPAHAFSSLLVTAFYVDLLKSRDVRPAAILHDLQERFLSMNDELKEGLRARLFGDPEPKRAAPPEVKEESSVRQCDLAHLSEGMVVAADIKGTDQAILVAKGRRLSQAMISRLRQMGELETVPIDTTGGAAKKQLC